MADNEISELVDDAGAGWVTAKITWSGDANQNVPAGFLGIISGVAESYVFTPYVAGAGAVDGGTQRVTLASNDPAVAALQGLAASQPLPTGASTLVEQQSQTTLLAVATGHLEEINLGTDGLETLLTTINTSLGTVNTSIGTVNTTLSQFSAKFTAASTITSENIAAPTATTIYSFGMVFDGATWDRMPGTSVDGLLVNLGANNDVDTELPAAAALGDTDANPTAPMVGSCLMVWNSATWSRLPGSTTDGMLVNLGANNDVIATGNAASAAADSGNPVKIGGKVDTTLPTYTDGQRANLQMDVRGKAYVTIGNGGNSQVVAAVVAQADALANTNGLAANAATYVYNGVTWDRVRGDTTTGMYVGGAIPHDTADSGNPNKVGFKATTSLAGLTLVGNNDRTDGFAGVDGVQLTRPYCNLEDIVDGNVSITDGSSTEVIAAQAAGVRTYITSCTITNTSATAVTVTLRDGAAGTVKWTFPVPANTSGVTMNFLVPLRFSAATAVCADPSAAASTITVSLNGFKSKV